MPVLPRGGLAVRSPVERLLGEGEAAAARATVSELSARHSRERTPENAENWRFHRIEGARLDRLTGAC